MFNLAAVIRGDSMVASDNDFEANGTYCHPKQRWLYGPMGLHYVRATRDNRGDCRAHIQLRPVTPKHGESLSVHPRNPPWRSIVRSKILLTPRSSCPHDHYSFRSWRIRATWIRMSTLSFKAAYWRHMMRLKMLISEEILSITSWLYSRRTGTATCAWVGDVVWWRFSTAHTGGETSVPLQNWWFSTGSRHRSDNRVWRWVAYTIRLQWGKANIRTGNCAIAVSSMA